MAMARILYPVIEPNNPNAKDTKENRKYWQLRGSTSPGVVPPELFFPFCHFPKNLRSSKFELQNNHWRLTIFLGDAGLGRSSKSLSIRVYNEIPNCEIDQFNMLIGIVRESGEEVAVEKAKPLENCHFAVYGLIDGAELSSILQSNEPYFLFVEIDRKGVETEQKAKENETKACIPQHLMNALRICNGTFPDTASSSAPPPAKTTSGLLPSIPTSSATTETSRYVTPPPVSPSLSKSTTSLPARPFTTMFAGNHAKLFEDGKFDPAVEIGGYPEPCPSPTMALIQNIQKRHLPPAELPMPSASNGTSPPLHPSVSKSHPPLPAGAPTPSLRTNYDQRFECGDIDPAESIRRAIKLSLQPEMTRIENYQKNHLPPAGFPMPSDSKKTSPPLHPSLSKSSPSPSISKFPSLSARASTLSLRTSKRKIQMDYRDLFLSGRDSDFIINVREMKIKAHMLILGSRSPVFLAMTESEVSVNDVDPDIFYQFLLYLYTGDEAHLEWKNIMELYKLGDKYCVEDLKELCVERMKTNISMKNFFEIFMLSQKQNHAELSEATIQFFLENSKQIIESERYIGFMKDYPDEAYVLIKASAGSE